MNLPSSFFARPDVLLFTFSSSVFTLAATCGMKISLAHLSYLDVMNLPSSFLHSVILVVLIFFLDVPWFSLMPLSFLTFLTLQVSLPCS